MASKKANKAVAANKEVPKAEEEAPVAKKAKTEAAAEEKADEASAPAAPVKPAEPEEPEKDSLVQKKPKLSEHVGFDAAETTLNVVPTMDGKVLMSLADGGVQYLIAGARANAGVKNGRYLYEVKVIETLSLEEKGGKGLTPKQLIRFGFSTSGSDLTLVDGGTAIVFDAEGYVTMGDQPKKKASTKNFSRLNRNDVIGILLNLDVKTETKNTVSLFRNGVRVSDPLPLPENLLGQTLYPHVAFRQVTLQVNFGPNPLMPLPFKCHCLQEAAAADVVVTKASIPKGAKAEVVFPVGFPDQGTFDCVDQFLEANPTYVELSSRKVADWAVKSGFKKQGSSIGSNDSPSYGFGCQALDDTTAIKILTSIAAAIPRNYVVMEVKKNLTATDRKEHLAMFPASLFKRVARVAMGEPKGEFKKLVKDKLLKEKKQAAERAWTVKRQQMVSVRAVARKKKELLEKQKKIAAVVRKNKKDADKAKKKAAGEEVPDDESDAEAEKEEEQADEEDDDKQPEVTLTEEEEKTTFVVRQVPDLAPAVLEKCFGKFSVPSKGEGFDDVAFIWQSEKKSTEYLRTWVLEKKKTTKVEVQPGDWFKAQELEWKKKVAEWQAAQKAAKAKGCFKKTDDDDEGDDSARPEVMSVENILDIGEGEPLFLNFGPDDWALAALRWELATLAVAFKKDVDDADRPAIPESHLAFYYQRYFKKPLTPKLFGKESNTDLCSLVKDTAKISSDVLSISVDDDAAPESFVKLTEEVRRARQRRIDAGDETARLKLSPQVVALYKTGGGKGGK